jgi:hypothetical protein
MKTSAMEKKTLFSVHFFMGRYRTGKLIRQTVAKGR